jgi:hypothetical protein
VSAPCSAPSANISNISMPSGIIRGRAMSCWFPRDTDVHREGPVECRERLGGGDLLDKLLFAHGGEHFKVFEAVQRHRAFPICLARASVNCATASIAAADRRRHRQPGQDLGGSDLGGAVTFEASMIFLVSAPNSDRSVSLGQATKQEARFLPAMPPQAPNDFEPASAPIPNRT